MKTMAAMRRAPAKSPRLQDARKATAFFEAEMSFTLGPGELKRRMEQGETFNVVDVRKPEAYAEGHIPGAISLPRERWEEAAGLRKDRLNVLYCSTEQCHLSTEACLRFAKLGFPVMHLEGGMAAWKEYQMDVATGAMPMEAMSQAA